MVSETKRQEPEPLEDAILKVFKRACNDEHFEVADHLLRALEELPESGTWREAYLAICEDGDAR